MTDDSNKTLVDYRMEKSQVDFATPEKDMIIDYIQKAEQFVNSVGEYLKA